MTFVPLKEDFRFTRHVLALTVGFLLTGCAATPPAVPNWSDHPANPAAAEAPQPKPSSTLSLKAAEPPPPSGEEAHTMEGMQHGAMPMDMPGMASSRPSHESSHGGQQ